MPALLLRLLPLLAGFLGQGAAMKGLSALTRTPKIAGMAGGKVASSLGRGGLLPLALTTPAFLGAEHLTSSALGLNQQAEAASGNAENFGELQKPQQSHQGNAQALQQLQQDDLLLALQNLSQGSVF